MMTGRYVGSIARLKGRRALLREDETTALMSGKAPMLLAQFDDRALIVDGVRMGFDWHLFEQWDFDIDPPVKDDA